MINSFVVFGMVCVRFLMEVGFGVVFGSVAGVLILIIYFLYRNKLNFNKY